MPVSSSSSAQQARQLLASRLADLRRDAGLTGVELARRCAWKSSAKVSRIEQAQQAPTVEDLRVWAQHCGVPNEAEDLIASLRVVEGMWVEWRRMERSGLRRAQEAILPLYERTTSFRAYSPSLVPGMIQTAEYVGAVLRSIQNRRGLVDDVDAAVAVRMDRQKLLNEGSRRFVFLIEEFVLYCRLVPDDVMIGQLARLLSVSTLPNVSLGIVPTAARRGLWPVEAFWIYDRAQASAELVSGFLTVTQPHEVALYEQAFAEIAEAAVRGLEARRLITAAIDAMG